MIASTKLIGGLKPAFNGKVVCCRRCADLNVQLVAHSPLEQGLLTDRYVEDGGDAKAAKARALNERHDLDRTSIASRPGWVTRSYVDQRA